MTDFIVKHFDAFTTSFITILGFVITYFMTKQNFKEEVKKDKINRTTEIIQSLPYDICQMMNSMMGKGKFSVDKYNEIMSKVLSYGSKDAVKIAVKLQRLSYTLNDNADSTEKTKLLAALALLITQLKYDLTSEIITPESWFLLKIKDYDNLRGEIKESINSLVFELELNHQILV